mmetsp:Transcript_120196/g.351272  ORF Transcript_120196/g.351272 Transcript_120196/m.351272 type:complete len:236 (-) Transcript_120196:397-1104(-)
MGIPKFMSGLSLEFFHWLGFGLQSPLRSAQRRIVRSLISVYWGFFWRKPSSQSKVPSSGRPTGKRTSYFPSLAPTGLRTSASSLATSCQVLHAKGRGAIGDGPKLTCKVTFLKFTCGKSAFSSRFSGRGWGCEMRTPSRKRLTVSELGLFLSRLSSTAMVWSRPKRWEVALRFLSAVKKPSESKHTLSSVSPKNREESCVEKPMRTSCRGMGARLPRLFAGSYGFRASTILTSKR